MGDFPTMTDQGTFIINGAERVVVSQLVRSPGVYYTAVEDPATGRPCTAPRSSPTGAPGWSSRPPPATCCTSRSTASASSRRPSCCARSATSPTRRWSRLFAEGGHRRARPTSRSTLEQDSTTTRQEALIEVYKKLRPGDPPTGDNAEKLVESLFFNFRRYDLGRVGRYKFNKKLAPVAGAHGHRAARAPSGPSAARTSRPSSATSSSSTTASASRTTSTTSATGASAPTASSSRTPSGWACCAWSAWSRSG